MTISWRSPLLLLCLLLANIAHGQNLAEDEGIISTGGASRLLGIGAGASYRSFVDKNISDMLYHRAGAAACISNQKTDEFKYTELTIQASYLNMQRDANDLLKGTAKSLKGAVDYRYSYKLKFLDEEKYDIRVGPMLSGVFDYRKADHLSYSSPSYDYAFTLGAYGKIARQVSTNDRLANIILDISIPFLADIGRPTYLNTNGLYNPDYKPLKNFFSNNSVGTFGKFFRLDTRVSWLYPLKNGNKIKFTYQWDYYRIRSKPGPFAYSAEHSLIMAFMFNY